MACDWKPPRIDSACISVGITIVVDFCCVAVGVHATERETPRESKVANYRHARNLFRSLQRHDREKPRWFPVNFKKIKLQNSVDPHIINLV